jgi:hypothetical protein
MRVATKLSGDRELAVPFPHTPIPCSSQIFTYLLTM